MCTQATGSNSNVDDTGASSLFNENGVIRDHSATEHDVMCIQPGGLRPRVGSPRFMGIWRMFDPTFSCTYALLIYGSRPVVPV